VRKKRWFELEEPIRVRSGPLELQWFKKRKILQFVAWYTDSQTGEEMPGKTFNFFYLRDLTRNPEALELLESVLEEVRRYAEKETLGLA